MFSFDVVECKYLIQCKRQVELEQTDAKYTVAHRLVCLLESTSTERHLKFVFAL